MTFLISQPFHKKTLQIRDQFFLYMDPEVLTSFKVQYVMYVRVWNCVHSCTSKIHFSCLKFGIDAYKTCTHVRGQFKLGTVNVFIKVSPPIAVSFNLDKRTSPRGETFF
jgi:hypothetical protein